ncbi:FAD-dependent oxidoreductase [Pyrobaculum aerophilum]|uniref:FAD-dependent oxidoreductase n=1 Tax=Pyrobaculum aerophilum TaxID=13773 RepID=UPI0023F4357A|nr:FAD-dependent oxidoreductase [Pyrobaculum aerophilum]MCX8136207.1 NAD(P)/FAD-dependent oxidoreductase [Pyrobaculum aerophilum]
MSCLSPIKCKLEASREDELNTDVLVVGSGLGGIVAALELKKYGYNSKIVYVGALGGHHVLGEAPRYSNVDIESIINKAKDLDISEGFFDGMYIYQNRVRYRVRYKHIILATGGVDVPITFPGSYSAPQKTAEEILLQPPSGLNVVVWGTTEWGLRTALTLRNHGNDVVVMDNSAYFRDSKYYELIKTRVDFPVITAVRIREFKKGELVFEVVTGKKENEVKKVKADLIVSAVRIVNPYIPMKLGFKVYYSFELNSLVPRRSNYGELLIVDERGKAVGGSNVYATGHLYGAVREGHIIEQGKLLAKYIAAKDGVEASENVKDALDKFLVMLTIEANWLYNLGNRLERGTDGTGRYVEPNVIDVPHWASFWPQIEEAEDLVICPCNNARINDVLKEIKQLNRIKELKVKITHEETELLRQLKLPKLSFGDDVCAESVCLTYASIILGGFLAQRPGYFIYGKPQMLYSDTS